MAAKLLNGLDLANQRAQNAADGSAATDLVTKQQLDAVARGLDWKQSVRAATTANITLSGTQTVDGVALIAGDRVLVKDQTTAANNGIYDVAAGAWTRAVDADSSAEVTSGMAVTVTEGTVNGDKVWVLTTNDPITLATTSLAFSQLGGGVAVVAGAGLTLTGSTLDVGAGTGITVAADSVGIDPAVVARKFAANIGDGSSTAIAVTHNLGTYDVIAQYFNNTSPRPTEYPDIERTDVNTVTYRFAVAPAAAAGRAVVIG